MLSRLLGNPWALLAAAAIFFGAGVALERELKDGEIAEIRLEHDRVLLVATKAKIAAEEAARIAEVKAVQDLATLSEQYVKEQEYEKAAADQRVADLLSANVRLRVAIQRPVGSCTLPGTAATAGAGDGQETATLPGSIAGRLARRYADYNQIVDELTLCQDTINTYRSMRPAQ